MPKKWTMRANIRHKGDLAMHNILTHMRTKDYDVVMEIRDARMPRSTAHPTLLKVCQCARWG